MHRWTGKKISLPNRVLAQVCGVVILSLCTRVLNAISKLIMSFKVVNSENRKDVPHNTCFQLLFKLLNFKIVFVVKI